VKHLPAPETAQEQLTLIQELLAEKDPPDVFGVDFIWSGTMRLTHIVVRLHLVGRNFIGESPDLTGWDFAGFLEKRLDRKDRQAGRNSRPEASQPALSTAIHPG
jgi:hypothetical protein